MSEIMHNLGVPPRISCVEAKENGLQAKDNTHDPTEHSFESNAIGKFRIDLETRVTGQG